MQGLGWNSLVVPWLGLSAISAMGPGPIPGQRTKIREAIWCGQKLKINTRKYVSLNSAQTEPCGSK